ncbi:hypothetical protein M3Y98_00816600 [Aphelenchoides besseyi]|nr:hypothetical protein M3Y98_00816600 [Aphelenchoides besseyi]
MKSRTTILIVLVATVINTIHSWAVIDAEPFRPFALPIRSVGPSAHAMYPEARYRTPLEAAVMREKLRNVLRELQRDPSALAAYQNPKPLPTVAQEPTNNKVASPLSELEDDRQSAVSKNELNRIADALRGRTFGGK